MFAFSTIRTFFTFIIISVYFAEQEATEKPYIDYLTLDYLSIEQSLWSRLNHMSDKNLQFSLVHDEHLRFIKSDFGISSNTQQTANFVPSGYLANNLTLVNNLFYNVSVVLRSESFDSVDLYYVHDVFAKANAYAESIFREAIRAEFWDKGKNVSEHCVATNWNQNVFTFECHEFQYIQHCRELEISPITVESEFQLIYNYYKDVRAALLKTYILTQLSHMLISINNKG